MRKLRILALMHGDLVPPEDTTGVDLATAEWRTEYNVVTTLREMGHEVRPLGVRDLEMPLAPMSVWRAIEAAKKGESA